MCTHLLPLALHTRNNTDGNKLVIFSGIALYYGDTYILCMLYFAIVLYILYRTEAVEAFMTSKISCRRGKGGTTMPPPFPFWMKPSSQ